MVRDKSVLILVTKLRLSLRLLISTLSSLWRVNEIFPVKEILHLILLLQCIYNLIVSLLGSATDFKA